ncbi:hypothetical protein [Alysiella crassa]|nr:hypothetical protein [Alysiella crassa]UOP07268.1 hypothetical protein LVJ80_02135 [Alysiella crassa]
MHTEFSRKNDFCGDLVRGTHPTELPENKPITILSLQAKLPKQKAA